jgi:hypothetical protein
MLRVRGLTMRYPNGKLALAGFDLNVEAASWSSCSAATVAVRRRCCVASPAC